MAFIDDIASKLSGRTRAETNSVMTDATTRTYVGTATSASEDGSVYVELSQDVTLPDDDDGEHGLGVEMPTTVAVDEGDEVLVTVFGGGVMKAPVVTGNPGWGDNVQTQVDNAETLAQQAEAVATATGQHFWPDDDGVHVTEVTQEDWNDTESPDYHSGANVLLNALGQLFRDGMSNLMALTTGAAYTETFEIRSDDQNQYTLTNKPMTVDSVTIDSAATDDYLWLNYDMLEGGTGGGTVVLGSETWYDNPGATLSVTYHTSPALTIYDGLGNLAANIQSYFTATEIGLGGNIYEDMAHKWWQTASVRFFGANDNRGASLEAGYSYNADESNINWDDTLGLGGTISDAEAPTVNGCVSESGVDTHRWLYDDTESSDDYRAESTAKLYAHSHGGDGYYGADATAQMGVKTVTVGDDYARSYVTIGDGMGEDTDIPLQQAIAALTLVHRTTTPTRSLGSGGNARAFRVGDLIVIAGMYSGVQVSSTYTWTNVCVVAKSDLGISDFIDLASWYDFSGGGPSYTGDVNVGGGILNSGSNLAPRLQVSKATGANRYLRFICVALAID